MNETDRALKKHDQKVSYFCISFDVTGVEKGSIKRQAENEASVTGTRGNTANTSRGWKDLCQEFSETTTLHGIRYTTLESRFVFRRYHETINDKLFFCVYWCLWWHASHLHTE